MLLKFEREKIIVFGKKLSAGHLTSGTGGNLSIFNREKNLFAITPSGMDYDVILPEDMVIMDPTGKIVEGSRKPSSEWALHSIFYKNRQDLDAIIHAHTNYATTLACMGKDLPPVHYMVAVAGKNIRLAEYASFGTLELAQNAYKAMKDRKAVLLSNHGLLAGGKTLEEAFNITEQIEYVSGIYLRALAAGEPIILDDEEMENMLLKFKTYGQ